jgi:tetratricopeptide (TPR) repeat protein
MSSTTTATMPPIEEANRLKASGNAQFASKDFATAASTYRAALQALHNAPASFESSKIKGVILSNRAACFLSMNRFQLAEIDATSALAALPPTEAKLRAKALWRRAQANKQLKQWNNAVDDLKAILHFHSETSPATAIPTSILNSAASCLETIARERSQSSHDLGTATNQKLSEDEKLFVFFVLRCSPFFRPKSGRRSPLSLSRFLEVKFSKKVCLHNLHKLARRGLLPIPNGLKNSVVVLFRPGPFLCRRSLNKVTPTKMMKRC